MRLRFARRLEGVMDIRLKGVDKFSVVTFEMVCACDGPLRPALPRAAPVPASPDY